MTGAQTFVKADELAEEGADVDGGHMAADKALINWTVEEHKNKNMLVLSLRRIVMCRSTSGKTQMKLRQGKVLWQFVHTIRAKIITCSPSSPQELIGDYNYSRGGGAELFSNYSHSRGRCTELISNSGYSRGRGMERP